MVSDISASSAHAISNDGDIALSVVVPIYNEEESIPHLYQRLTTALEDLDQPYDVVSGWRARRQDPFLNRRLPSILANRLISWVTGVRLHDYGCSLKAYRLEVVRGIHLYGELHRFIPAIASWQGVRLAEIPVHHEPRRFGKSKYGISRTLRVVLDLITVRFLLSYGTRPMQIFGLPGLISILLGGALTIYLGFVRLILLEPIGNRPLLMLAVLLTVLGVQFLALGLLGELMVRVYYEGTGRAIYTVREEIHAHPRREL